MNDKIRYPRSPAGVQNLDRFQGLKKNWDFSRNRLEELSENLSEELGSTPISVVVAGSFGRFDACPESDLDFMLVSQDELEAEDKITDKIKEVASSFNMKPPNPEGVFSQCIVVPKMMQTIGSRDDSLVSLAQRMLLLMESKPIYNESMYRSAVDQFLTKYLELVIADPPKEAIFMLNDIIRYFRSICTNYQFNFWREEERWVIRNIKLRHSRIIMYAGLVLLVMNASKNRTDKFGYISSEIHLTPIEKIIHVYSDNNDPNIDRVLGHYDVFLRKISDPEIRQALQVDYDDRYLNPYYADLKVNSDSLQTELVRFIFARKGSWADQIYEYLIF